MKARVLFFTMLSLFAILTGCLNESGADADRVKTVEMTFYAETGYAKPILSSVWMDVLIYSESDDPQRRTLSNTIIEGFDFLNDFERGYEYTCKAQKVWMNNPPMDVSSIKYVFAGSLEKKKVIVGNREEDLELIVMPGTVKYVMNTFKNMEAALPYVYDAMFCSDTNTNIGTDELGRYVLPEIEGFEFESGYQYILNVKKITKSDPYALRFVLIDVKDKKQAEMPEWLKY
ncbi:MAG: DUF4377 domain-containing protein [Tannerella sp.]|nr:DUF4377 domain-containing protein [Tannerella sp.]